MHVSVIIPVYNREDVIRESMRSVLEQTFADLELIVVDDGSSDDSVEKAREIKDERVRVIACEKNRGACAARNRGIEEAEGELIAFQDSDDIWRRDKLKRSIDAMEETQADLVFCARELRDLTGGIEKTEKIPYYNLNEYPDKLERVLVSNCASTQTMLARREVFQKIRFDEDLPRFQDWDLMLQILKAGYKVHYLDEVLVDCSVLGNSITGNPEKGRQALRILEQKYEREWKKYPGSYEEYCAKAAFSLECAGLNGSEFFLKEYRAGRKPYAMCKYLLSRSGLYRYLNPEVRKKRR